MNETVGEMEEWVAGEEDASVRIDKFIANACEDDISRTLVQQWIRDGCVRVNGQQIKPNYKLQRDDRIELQIPETVALEATPEPIPLDVIYEDRDVIVINKPRGMVVHPAPGHHTGTLVNALLHHCHDLSGINGVLRPGIVHRIDKDTSGLLVAAKNDKAHNALAEQLKDHTMGRQYWALVQGNLEHDAGKVDAPIGRDPKDRKLYTVTAQNGKPAVTHFQVLERFGEYTWVDLRLETGRTHQIRVHMRYIGHPLVGDPAYGIGGSKLNLYVEGGQMLHAHTIGFIHPRSGETLEFHAPIPAELGEILDLLRKRI